MQEGFKEYVCVYWDESFLRWSRDGCELDETSTSDKTIVCRCSHLTDFSLILGYKSEQDDLAALNYFSYGVCGASVLALLVTQIFKHCVK